MKSGRHVVKSDIFKLTSRNTGNSIGPQQNSGSWNHTRSFLYTISKLDTGPSEVMPFFNLFGIFLGYERP
jgi:hypothetical protein